MIDLGRLRVFHPDVVRLGCAMDVIAPPEVRHNVELDPQDVAVERSDFGLDTDRGETVKDLCNLRSSAVVANETAKLRGIHVAQCHKAKRLLGIKLVEDRLGKLKLV